MHFCSEAVAKSGIVADSVSETLDCSQGVNSFFNLAVSDPLVSRLVNIAHDLVNKDLCHVELGQSLEDIGAESTEANRTYLQLNFVNLAKAECNNLVDTNTTLDSWVVGDRALEDLTSPRFETRTRHPLIQ